MRKAKLLLGTIALSATVVGLANAGEDGARRYPGPRMMGGAAPESLPISVQALNNLQAARFSEADANGDGQLDVTEVRALLMRLRAQRSVQWLDRDGDGALSQNEFTTPVTPRGMSVGRDIDNRNRYGEGEHEDEDEEEEEEEHEQDEDEDEDDDDGATAGPAPAGTTAPPDNGLIAPGSTPKVNTN